MPTDREAMEYIRQGIANGIPPEQLHETLRKAGFATKGGSYAPPPDIAEAPTSLPADVREAQAAGTDYAIRQQEKEAMLTGAGALLGGLGGEAAAARFIPKVAMEAPRIIRMISTLGRIAPEIVGEAVGTYGGGKLSGMTPEEARNAAVVSAGGGLAGRMIARVGTRAAGRFAGMRPETTQAGIENPALLNAPEPDAELAQARRLGAQLEAQRGEITPAHADYQKMLGSKAQNRVDGNDILDIFQRNVAGRDNKPSLAADREVQRMAQKFIDRLGPDSKISLGELDDYIRQEFTKPLVGQYARESEAVAARRMMDVRRGLTEYLYNKIGPDAAPAQEMAQRSISTREAVENVFDLGKETKPTGTAADRIRGILGDSGEAQKNRAVLAAYDEEYGTHHLEDAKRLAMQREWQGKDMEKVLAVDSVLQPQRPGFVRGAALPVARGGARIARVAGPVSAAVTAGTRVEKRKRKKEPK